MKKRMVLGLVIVTALVQKRWKTMILVVMLMTIMMMVVKKMVVKMAVGLKKVREVGKVVPARKRSLAM